MPLRRWGSGSVTREVGTSKAPAAFPRAGAPSSVSTQSAWSPWQPSAPEGIRTPNLLIRSQMLYPLSYGRECCSEIPCGIARSNDGQDYRLHPAPTKSVCRPPEPAARHTSRSGRLACPRGGPAQRRAPRPTTQKGKKRNGIRRLLATLARRRQAIDSYSWVVRLFTSGLDRARYLLARRGAYLGQIRSVHHVDTRSDDPGRRGRTTS